VNRLKRFGHEIAFAAVFAAAAFFIFRGTWSTTVHAVMPDCAFEHPADWAVRSFYGLFSGGRFSPDALFVFLGGPWVWQELQYCVYAFFAAVALAWFLRGRGLPKPAAYGAGIFLAFSGYWFSLYSAGHLGWFHWMAYGVFAFGLIDRAFDFNKARHWLLLGATLAWGSMRQPDLWLLFSVFAFVYFLYKWIRARAVKPYLVGLACAAAAFVAIGFGSFRGAITVDLAGRDKQIEESKKSAAKDGQGADSAKAKDDSRWEFVTNWSLPPEDTLEFFIPRVHGDTSCPFTLALGRREGSGVTAYTGRLGRPMNAPQGNYRQHSVYVGFITCALALFGLVMAFVRREEGKLDPTVKFFAIAALVTYLFSLGRFCEPVYRLVYMLPMGDYLRAPVKWHHLTELSLAVLAGYGLAALLKLKFKGAFYVAIALVLVGAFDLARVNRLYCAPMRHNADYTVVPRQQLQNQQVLAQLKQLRAWEAGVYGPYSIVGIPKAPQKPEPPKLPATDLTFFLSLLSMSASFAVLGFAAVSALIKKSGAAVKD